MRWGHGLLGVGEGNPQEGVGVSNTGWLPLAPLMRMRVWDEEMRARDAPFKIHLL